MAPSSLSISVFPSHLLSWLLFSLSIPCFVSGCLLTLPGSLSVYCCCDTHLHTLPPTLALFGSLGLRGQNVTGSTCALTRPKHILFSSFILPHSSFPLQILGHNVICDFLGPITYFHIFFCFYHQTAKLPSVFLVSPKPQPFGLDQPSREASAPWGPG